MTSEDRLLAILQAQPGRSFSYEQLGAQIWPQAQDYPRPHLVHHLHELAHRLRTIGDVAEGTIATIINYGYVWVA